MSRAASISPEVQRELALARQRGKRIRRAVGVALFNGWSVGVFAGISLLGGLFSFTSLLIGIVLAIVSYNELSGARLLRRLDVRAPRRLGFNQMGFCVLLVGYCLWRIHDTLTGPNPYEAALASAGQMTGLLGSIEQLRTTVTLAVYGSLILLSVVFQGGTAWYYFTRERHIRTYVRETPSWLLDLQRGGSTL